MLVFKTSQEIRAFFYSKPGSLGLVPTMGTLHKGHISLINKACSENDFVIVSIYVNPTQFNRKIDLHNYPSNLKNDVNILENLSNQIILYNPSHPELYPNGIKSNSYNFGSLTQYMEGRFRPGHFNGVATVIEVLFKKINPNKAYFGEKDYQQIQVIKSLNRQKKLGVNIVSCPIIREKDGLAMSSRNKMLSPNQRDKVPLIYNTLQYFNQNPKLNDVKKMELIFKENIEKDNILKVEYFCVASSSSLIPIRSIENKKNYRFFVSVFAGKTRLIDSIKLDRK